MSLPSTGTSSEEADQKKGMKTPYEVNEVPLSEKGVEIDEDFRYNIIHACGHNFSADKEKGGSFDLPADIEYMIDKIGGLKIEDAIDILKKAYKDHYQDQNFPSDVYLLIHDLLDKELYLSKGHTEKEWTEESKIQAGLIYYYSPYPEVRTVTSPLDIEDVPIETIRSYILGIIWTIIGAGVNEFFMHRKPRITLTAPVIQVLLYPCGKFCEHVLPDWGFKFRGKRFSLNPGPWTAKEQMFSTLMFNVAISYTYVSHNIYVQKLKRFYNNDWVDIGYEILLMLSSQFMGFGFAGIVRKFVIYPEKCIWPTAFPTLALNSALLKGEKHTENINGWRITRYHFFLVCFIGMFLYFWIPNYLFQALSTFDWLAWIKPQNFNLAVVTGSQYGLGLNPIPTFDWNIIDYNYAITIPFFSQLNQYIGSFIGFFAIIGIFYSNYKWSGYLPLNDNNIYTNTGELYEVTEILNKNSQLVESKYQKYSPPFYTAGNLLIYGAYFALYPFSFCYTVITEWSTIKNSFKVFYHQLRHLKLWKSNYDGFDDPQTRMMKKYKEVPDWYFLVILVICIVLGILAVKLYPAQTPVWGIFLILVLNLLLLIPICLIFSITGYSITMGVITEVIIGYLRPNSGLCLMTLKSLSYQVDNQAESFIADQKLAHYAKIPQRSVFRGQLIAVFFQCLTALCVINWQINNIPGICTDEAENHFTCPKDVNFYSSSVFWGVIGPRRIFSGLYPILKWCFLIGFLLAPLCAALKRYFPKYTTHFEPSLIIGGMLQYAPYNLSYLTGGLYASYAFMHYLKKHHARWWEKYNYVLAASFSSAVAFSAIIIFFAVKYHPKPISWWGNDVLDLGVEGGEGQQTLLNATSVAGGYFGPRKGDLP